MGIPYEMPLKRVTTSDADEIVALDFPSRVVLKRVAAHHSDGTQFYLNVYNRAFTWAAAVDLLSITSASGQARLRAASTLDLKVGDTVTVANCSVVAYNAVHRVVTIVDQYTVITDQAFTVNAADGDVTLDIQANEQHLYQVLPQQTSSASGVLLYFPPTSGDEAVFFNQDPSNHMGNRRKIYLKFSQAGTYSVVIGGATDFD